ncbi:NtaA/DmoA family FMN-dependent monooxygenase [Sedimentitalea sp. XS_ASV28]|uniref:NtaA/DmoA family FMN-dependent monooxygenase n=1 Tax=Sedimentitalea sp. XS_ASV28 TaxID=3241296 RepID=UPI0035138583
MSIPENSNSMAENKKILHIGMSLAATWLDEKDSVAFSAKANDTYPIESDIELCRMSETAKLDFMFLPDTLFANPRGLRGGQGPGPGSLDPTLKLAALSQHSSHVGLLTTVSTTFFPPYIVARQLQTLHWLSGGRAGWNIVTALDGHRNFGFDDMPSPDEKYARAAEFTEVVRRLWASNPAPGTEGYDQSLIQPIEHEGSYFKVAGPLNVRAPNSDRIPLIQAGASETGREFAAQVADAIFASTPDKDAAISLRADLRKRAVAHGREADDIVIMPGLNCYLAETRAEAQDLFMETNASIDRGRRLDMVKKMIGIDLTDWPDDRPIRAADLPALPGTLRSRTHSELLRRMIQRDEPTVSELLQRPESAGSGHWRIIGTVDDAAEQIAEWHRDGAIDGFINVPGGGVDSMKRTLHDLIPQLAQRGLFRKDYKSKSFLGHLRERWL